MLTMTYHESFSESSIYAMLLSLIFGFLVLLSLDLKTIFKNKVIRFSFICLVLIAIISLVTSAYYNDNLMTKDIRAIGMCIGAIIIGYNIRLSKREYLFLILLFCSGSLLVGMEQVTNNIGGFIIEDQYLTEAKNSLGVLLATTAVVSAYNLLFSDYSRIVRIGFIAVTFFSVLILLTIRARADSLATLIVLFVMVVLKYSRKNWMNAILVICILAVICVFILPDSVVNFVYNSFFQHYEGGDVTAGRAERNVFALNYIYNNLFTGNMVNKIHVPTVHNFILYKWFCYGILFSIPIIVLYFLLLFHTINSIFHTTSFKLEGVGLFVLLIPFIVSLFEYSFPFGPGTATLFNYVIFGYSLRLLQPLNNNTELLR